MTEMAMASFHGEGGAASEGGRQPRYDGRRFAL